MKSVLIFFFCCSIHLDLAQEVKQFEFIYSEKMGDLPSVYNSATNTYLMDMVMGPRKEIKVKLSEKERQQIENKIRAMDIFSYPDKFKFIPADSTSVEYFSVKPCSEYSIAVSMDGKEKSVSWSNCMTTDKSVNYYMYVNLSELSNLIDNIIRGKRKVKRVKPRAYYM